MGKIRDRLISQSVHAGLASAILLTVVLMVPDASASHSVSFFRLAYDSSWRHPGDLPAAWCSLKIIILSVGVFLLTDAASKLMEALRHERLAITASFAGFPAIVGCLFGFYQLIKALL